MERLSRLSSILDTTIFGGPSYRLTTRTPYQASPEAWVVGDGIDYFSPRVDGIQWTPEGAPSQGGDRRDLFFYFSQLPAERSLLSISLVAAAVAGTVGHVSVGYVPLDDEGGPVAGQVRIPLQDFDTEHLLDLTFDSRGMDPPEFAMTLEANITWLMFTSVTLRTAPLVVFPGPF
jgi:hypothetical protein